MEMLDDKSKFNYKNIIQNLPKYLFVGFLLWFILAFLINPVVTLFYKTFVIDGSFTFTAFDKIRRSGRALESIKNSFLLAIALSVTVNLVGTFLVLVTEYFEVKGAKILRVAYMSTLVFAGIILNNGYLYLYGPSGILTKALLEISPNLDPYWFQGFPAVLFVMTFAITSNHMIFLRNAIKGLDFGTIEAAKNMGASQWDILKDIVFPTLKPMFITLTVMIFQIGVGALTAPLMVGGKDFQTIGPMILTFSGRPRSRDIAALLSIILGLAQILLLFILTQNEKRGNYLSVSKTKSFIKKQKINNPIINFIVHGLAYALFIIYAAPVILVILFSFMNTESILYSKLSLSGFTLDNYVNVLTNSGNIKPFITSFLFSALSIGFAILFMLFVVRLIMKHKDSIFYQLVEFSIYIPWLLPGLLMALGLIMAYDSPSKLILGNVAVGSLWVLPIAYVITSIPTILRYLKSAYFSFDNNLEEASQILGASSIRTYFKVILPALLPTALALFALNFNEKMSDYNLAALLHQPAHPTVGILIYSNTDPAASIDAVATNLVYSVILMAISTLVLYLVYGKGTSMSERKSGL